MKINQTLFFIILALSISMVESAKQNKVNGNSKTKTVVKRDPKLELKIIQENEAIASKVFDPCTANQWKGVKSTFNAVKTLISQSDITSFPKDFDKLTRSNCYMARAKGSNDIDQGIETFGLTYHKNDGTEVYFPIVTKNFNKFELSTVRTISAQKNTLLTNYLTNEKFIDQNNTHTQTNEDQENVNLEEQPALDRDMIELEKMADDVENGKPLYATQNNDHEYHTKENHHELKDINEVNKHMVELEKMADDVENGKPLYPTQNNHHEHHTEENHHELKDINEVNKHMQELEKMASIVENRGYIYPLNEHQNEDGDVHNHIQKHNTHNSETQTDDDENTLEDLFRESTDINDHVEAPSHSNHRDLPLLGGDHDLPLLGGDHDVNLLKPTEEDDSMNNITPLFSESDYDVSPKNIHTSTQEEGPHFHNTEIEDYDFFAQKRNKHEDKQEHINRLDDNESSDINDAVASKAQPEHDYSSNKHHARVGGWSEPKPCSDEEKHTTIAYVTKMTLSSKVLGLIPSTQNVVSCAHQIVAGTNFSVIIQINNDICEVVYNVDLENIVHDLNKSYAQREVPCVDMYARHLF